MKFCPNCGAQAEAQSHFCGECGFSFASAPAPEQPAYNAEPAQPAYNAAPEQPAYNAAPEQPAYSAAPEQPVYNTGIPQPVYNSGIPQPEPYAEPKKNRAPVFIAIAVAALALIAIIAVAVSSLGGGKKSTDFIGAQKAFVEERATEMAGSVVRDSFSSDVTVSMSLNGRGEAAELFSEILDGSSIVLKTDSASGKTLMNAALHLKGSNVLEAFFSMTADRVAFSVPNANDTLYVADLMTLMENLDIDMSDLPQTVNAKEMRDEIKSVTDRYLGVLSSSINKEHIETKKSDVKLSEVGKTVSCTVMVWTPDEEELVTIAENIADTLETDEDLAAMLDAYALADGEYRDGMEMLEELADEIRKEAAETARQTVEENSTWTVALDGKGKVVWISIADDVREFAIERYADDKEGAEVMYATEDGHDAFMIINEYTAKGQARTGTLSAKTAGGTVDLDYDIDLSKRSVFGIPYGTYTPDLRNLLPGLNVDLTVRDAGGKSTDHIITVTGLGSLTGDELTEASVTVNATEKSTAKEPAGREEDISDYSPEELETLADELIEEIGSALMKSPEIMDVLEMLGGF